MITEEFFASTRESESPISHDPSYRSGKQTPEGGGRRCGMKKDIMRSEKEDRACSGPAMSPQQ
jgi:hypothetical protein